MSPYQKNIVSFLVQLNIIVWLGIALYAFVWIPYQDVITERFNTIALRPTSAPTAAPTPTPTILPTQTATARRIVVPTLAPIHSPIVAPVALAAPGGTSSSSPLMPGDTWRGIDAGARVWYRIASGGVHMDVFLEANPLDGITFDVYAPGNLDKPIGQGTLQASSGRLTWSGGHWDSTGDWLARVNNANPSSVQYKLTSQTQVIPKCDSISYWEYIGKNLVYWTRCK